MGFRFRKSIKIMPGVKVNLGKNGVTSYSIGGKGITKNISKKGERTTFSIPGTGVSYSEYKPYAQNRTKLLEPTKNEDINPRSNMIMGVLCIILGLILFSLDDAVILSKILLLLGTANIVFTGLYIFFTKNVLNKGDIRN